MAYAQTVSRTRMSAILLAILIHVLLAYAFVTGLAFTVIDQVSGNLKTFDVVEPTAPAEEIPAEPVAEAEPTPVEAAPSPVPTDRNPIAAASSSISMASAAPGAVATGATLRRGAFHNERDYPGAARRAEEQGTVQVRFTVGADGRVSGCTVVGSSGSSSLDSTTCRIFERRFRYSPARDAGGNPVPQTMTQSVSWRLN